MKMLKITEETFNKIPKVMMRDAKNRDEKEAIAAEPKEGYWEIEYESEKEARLSRGRIQQWTWKNNHSCRFKIRKNKLYIWKMPV